MKRRTPFTSFFESAAAARRSRLGAVASPGGAMASPGGHGDVAASPGGAPPEGGELITTNKYKGNPAKN